MVSRNLRSKANTTSNTSPININRTNIANTAKPTSTIHAKSSNTVHTNRSSNRSSTINANRTKTGTINSNTKLLSTVSITKNTKPASTAHVKSPSTVNAKPATIVHAKSVRTANAKSASTAHTKSASTINLGRATNHVSQTNTKKSKKLIRHAVHHGLHPDMAAEINRRLLETGELKRLESHLLQLLQANGWTEQLRTLCRDRLRDPELSISNYRELRGVVEEDAVVMVPENVRVEIIRHVLDVVKGFVEE